MIHTIGQVPESRLYEPSSFELFLEWERAQLEFELDVETTVSEWWCDKKLITMQFGSVDGRTQWFFRWLDLTDEQKAQIKVILENPRKTKLIHNGLFEYVVLRFHNIKLENVYDTMLAEQVLYGGITSEKGKESLYSLKAMALTYCCVELDKSFQLSFNEEPLIEGQVLYACDDVKYLSAIRRMQIPALKMENSENTAALEMEAMLGYGDMTYNGIELNTHDWLENLKFADPIIESTRDQLNASLFQEPKLYAKAIELGYLSEQDRLTINWNSANQKKQLLGWMCEDLELYTKAYIQKFLKKSTFGDDIDKLLFDMMDGEYMGLTQYLINNYRPSLIREGYLVPAGQVTLNWNSRDQVLPLAKAVEPKLQGLAEEDIAKTSHWILPILQEYKQNLKLKTTYGEEFVEKHLEPDGKIRTRFNQIISTGRVSSSKPNMQNIPAKESVGNRYRNAFTCPADWVYVDSDFSGQELVVIAYLSQDPVWMEALRKGQDLHSVCSELVFKKKWEDGAEEGCAYYTRGPDKEFQKQKCNCKLHKRMRNSIKPINFG
jgi:hypothetical protein